MPGETAPFKHPSYTDTDTDTHTHTHTHRGTHKHRHTQAHTHSPNHNLIWLNEDEINFSFPILIQTLVLFPMIPQTWPQPQWRAWEDTMKDTMFFSVYPWLWIQVLLHLLSHLLSSIANHHFLFSLIQGQMPSKGQTWISFGNTNSSNTNPKPKPKFNRNPKP